MRRADRLFEIIQSMRRQSLVRARDLSAALEVSERTIYRDIQDLVASGVPIEGEAGVGYRMRPGFDLPPLMFTFDEIEAIVAGTRMVEAWGSPELAKAGRSALAKIAGALPPSRRDELEKPRLFAMAFNADPAVAAALETIRQSIARRRVLEIDYRDAKDAATLRPVRPLGLYFWGKVWTLGAWCETRNDFRNFRLDRMVGVTMTDRRFVEERGKSLNDFLRKMQAERPG